MSMNRSSVTATLILIAATTLACGKTLRAMLRVPVPVSDARSEVPAQSQEAERARRLTPAQKAQAEREARAKSENNLKQLALAMHNVASMSNPPRFTGGLTSTRTQIAATSP